MQAALFDALADPTRLRLLEALREGERSVGELVEGAGIHQSGVSRHLRILQEAGLVQVRADAQRRLYSVREATFAELEEWAHAYRRHWDARLDRMERALAERRRSKKEPE